MLLSYSPNNQWVEPLCSFLETRDRLWLEAAIEAARQSSDSDAISEVLSFFQEKNFSAVCERADKLHAEFMTSGREHEAKILLLLGYCCFGETLFSGASKDFISPARENSSQGAFLAEQLGLAGCAAWLHSMVGLGCLQLQDMTMAIPVFERSIHFYSAVFDTLPSTRYQFCKTMACLGMTLSITKNFQEAEQIYSEALVLGRVLLQDDGYAESDLAMLLADLGHVQVELLRLTAAQTSYREAIRLFRRAARNEPKRWDSHLATALTGLGNALRHSSRHASAIRVMRQSVSLFRDLLKDKPGIEPQLASALYNLGHALAENWNWSASLVSYREASDIFDRFVQAQPDELDFRIRQARTLCGLGDTLRLVKRLDEAIEELSASVELYRQLIVFRPDLEIELARTLQNLAVAHSDSRNIEPAIAAAGEAVEIFLSWRQQENEQVTNGARWGLAEAQSAIANILGASLRVPQAIEAYQKAVECFQFLKDQERSAQRLKEAQAYIGLGSMLRLSNRTEEAEEWCEAGIGLLRALQKDPQNPIAPYAANALIAQGNALRFNGWNAMARAVLWEGVELLRPFAQRSLNQFGAVFASALSNWADCHLELGDYHTAALANRDAVAIFYQLSEDAPENYEFDLSRVLSQLGFSLYGLWQFEGDQEAGKEGLGYCATAVQIARFWAGRHPEALMPLLAGMLSRWGYILNEEGEANAQETLEEAISIFNEKEMFSESITPMNTLGRFFMRQRQWKIASHWFSQSVKQIERLRAQKSSLDRRRQILQQYVSTYEQWMICLLYDLQFEAALEVAELSKSRTISDLFSLDEKTLSGIPVAISEEYETALLETQRLERETFIAFGKSQGLREGDAPFSPFSDKSREELLSARRRLREAEVSLRQHLPTFEFSTPLTVAEMRDLAADTVSVLILFRLTPKGTFVFLMFPDGHLEVIPLQELTWGTLNQQIFGVDKVSNYPGWILSYNIYREAVESNRKSEAVLALAHWRDVMDETLGHLYENLLAPVLNRVREYGCSHPDVPCHSLVLVPNRILALLPLHACWWEEEGQRHYVLDHFSVRFAPSLSVLQRCSERDRLRDDQDKLLAVCNPQPPGDLVFAEWEVSSIKEMMGAASCLSLAHDNAPASVVLAQMPHHQILHFATHAHYGFSSPMESKILFSNGESLSLEQILAEAELPTAWLVTLSACESSLVDFQEMADEHYGLPVGFLLAGAPTVYGSLWMVGAFSTALLMVNVYRHLLKQGHSKATALQKGQLELRNLTAEQAHTILETIEVQLSDPTLSTPNLRLIQMIQEESERMKRKAAVMPQSRPFEHPYYWAAFQCIGA